MRALSLIWQISLALLYSSIEFKNINFGLEMSLKNTNFMANDSVAFAYLKLSIPVFFGMSIQGLYGIIDAIFITKYIGKDAMAGFSIFFPILLLIGAVGVMLGTGAAVLVARFLGANKLPLANRIAIQAIFMGGVWAICFSVLFLTWAREILLFLGATESIINYAVDFATPLVLCMPIIVIATIFGDLLRAEGKTNAMFAIMLCASILNVVFDFIFIVVFEMGMFGAAVATVLANTIALICAVLIFHSDHTRLTLSLTYFGIGVKECKDIVLIGLPTLIGNLSYGILIFVINYLIKASEAENAGDMISAFGLVFRVLSFVVLPLIAMMSALQTLSSYNFGAEKYNRCIKSLKVALLYASFYSILMTLLVITLPEHLYGLFTDDKNLLLEIYNISFLIFLGLFFLGGLLVFIGFLQSVKKEKYSMLLVFFKLFLQVSLTFSLSFWFGVGCFSLILFSVDLLVFILAAVLSLIALGNLVSKPANVQVCQVI
ncbi:putative efflux protein, MATE family [Photorhabdus luminescens]|uniref:Putative efflux protein, MATE family n=2 Tax=Morganellaceae TaxID=1903414 RepID=A0A1G5R2I2_PHOLU|nr:putative efflux protein, MATE family [Photorhabdus luminescens]